MTAFTLALESLHRPVFSIGKIPPTPNLVDQYFNDFTGAGDNGDRDMRGPWNEGRDWQYLKAPALADLEHGSVEPAEAIEGDDHQGR